MNKILKIIIPNECINLRLDQALARLLPLYSRTQIQDWILKGKVTINGQHTKAKIMLKGGEEICLEPETHTLLTNQAEAIPLNIVYEDETLLVINKPPGLIVHPGAGNPSGTLLNALLYHAADLAMLPRGGILHRLDKDTSGLLIVAKTLASLKKLTHQLKKRQIIREYQAIAIGQFISGGKIDAPIARHFKERKRMSVSEHGKPAITHYRVMEKYRAHTLLLVRLETGRTHQIRVHFASIHHPLVGDPTYGGRLQLAKGMSLALITALREFKRQALHAFALTFAHPLTEKTLHFTADLPDDMQQLIKQLKKDKEEK